MQGTMYPALDPKLAVYSSGVASRPAADVKPMHWLPALPGHFLGDDVKYFQTGKRRSYGRLLMALLAVLLLAGLTADRYIASDDLKSSVVVSRITGEAISQLPDDELLTATCPCKESLVRWSSIVSFTPSILAMSHRASESSDGFETYKLAQCMAIALNGRPDVIDASAINDMDTYNMMNNDTCYKWPLRTCAYILYDLRATIPLVKEDDDIADQSPYLILPLMKAEAELLNMWRDYVGGRVDQTWLTAYNSVVAHNQGMGGWLDRIASNSSLQPRAVAFKSFLDYMTTWLLANHGDNCSSNAADLDARGNKRVHANIRETTKAFVRRTP